MKKIVWFVLGLILLVIAAFIFWPEKAYKPYQVDAAYRAQVDDFYIPPMPADWQLHKFETADGTNLRWGETGNRGAAKATLIWVPGYTAHLNMYGEHFDALAERGFHVVGVDLRGQGGSDRHRAKQPEKLWVEDFSVYSDDLAAFLASLELPPDRPLLLNGISFGGHVAIRAVRDHATNVDGLFLIAPAIKPTSGEYSFDDAKRMMGWARRLGKANYYMPGESNWLPDGFDLTRKTDCSSNPSRLYYRDVIFTRQPELRVGGVTVQWGSEFFESSEIMQSGGYLEAIELPVTIISAENDTYVYTDVNSSACQTRFQDCREVAIAGTGHCLPQESDGVLNQMFDEMDALAERITLGLR